MSIPDLLSTTIIIFQLLSDHIQLRVENAVIEFPALLQSKGTGVELMFQVCPLALARLRGIHQCTHSQEAGPHSLLL